MKKSNPFALAFNECKAFTVVSVSAERVTRWIFLGIEVSKSSELITLRACIPNKENPSRLNKIV